MNFRIILILLEQMSIMMEKIKDGVCDNIYNFCCKKHQIIIYMCTNRKDTRGNIFHRKVICGNICYRKDIYGNIILYNMSQKRWYMMQQNVYMWRHMSLFELSKLKEIIQ